MTDLSVAKKLMPYKPKNKLRFITAAALFDGHDASINIMRRIMQATGAEVIHLGHNRSVQEIVNAALQEDVQGIAITSYQGGHVEFFKYMMDLLKANGGSEIKVFGGGGGVIVPSEIKELHEYGVTRIYAPEDGVQMGLQGMINDLVRQSDFDVGESGIPASEQVLAGLKAGDKRLLARVITLLENGAAPGLKEPLLKAAAALTVPVLGITGTGGAGKSSLTDELVRRFRLDQNDAVKIGLISIDPSRKRTGGALLGDRIRMNAIEHPNIFMRSLATRDTGSEVSAALPEVIAACKLAGFDLVIVETSGIGQGNAAIVPFVDVSMYVMTPEFGAASQLEKIDMLDFADFVAINKFDRKGAEDALRDVRKQYQRNRELFAQPSDEMPVFGTQAARFNDDGVTALYQALVPTLVEKGLKLKAGKLPVVSVKQSSSQRAIVPAQRIRYLAEIAESVRAYHAHTDVQVKIARERQSLRISAELFKACDKSTADFAEMLTWKDGQLDPKARKLLDMWPATVEAYSGDEYVVKIRDKEIRTRLVSESLSGTKIRKVILPKFGDDGETLRFLMKENVPGSFPFTAGVFAFKREGEDPTRMFAGEGDAFRTNRRFKRVSEGMPAKRLSTAFDSVTLYGCDPDERPDIYGKIGNSGVSIATVDDMKVVYDGFDLCSPTTSVSMTINGPAPIILACYFNTAIDEQIAKFKADNGREPTEDEAQKIREWTLSSIRGTVQADILKEDQGQNTCIFSTEFALKMMGDIQEYFVHHKIQNFYSVSISGYHIAEAGANPISQLAFTLSNGFTYVESYLARGMQIDDFAPNLSFFFSNGMDPEYSVIGRVARRIWAVAMKNKYGANERSQKLKYHIQTSGRSLHAQEMDFNDIRTTLQALIAIYDNCNSLHTNAYDEAITTPTEESVRRAMAIQLIINREWGVAKNENPNQGAFVIEELTDLVEEAVLKEFEAIASRGGVLGAMETGYQRGKIQEESMYYEHQKHDGSYPIIGVNTFLNPKGMAQQEIELARSTEEE
ncbi:MAG TPA: fused isobutyryl-CoA mutase/GTPase IcmF, partial [Azonexus sp.]|nr:fused isobutyryl-CoA mutase/GTPase IcmF [Azonexus sp.]